MNQTLMRKKLFTTFYLGIMLLFLTSGIKAQNTKLGVDLKGSTMGWGGDLVFQFHKRMTARLGYDQMHLSFSFDFEESDISYTTDVNIKTGSFSALYDFYLTNYIFVSTGVALNNFNIKASGYANSDYEWGDISISSEDIGEFEFTIKPSMPVSPYLGLGFGHTLGKNRALGFCFEVGAYYQGSPDITIYTTGMISPTSDPAFEREELYESQVSQYYLYPVLKLSLNYKICSF